MSKNLDENVISELQKIRRANNAILGCAQILNESIVLKACIPGRLGAYLQVTSQQECGLIFAIEACSRFTDDLFTEYLEDLGIGWSDEHLPEVRKEAEAHAEMISGKITYAEYERKLNDEDPLKTSPATH